ncbi:MAG: carbonic anhydrase [Actinomycetia bacterium]|nr:carbonic anhydrase [Actinomycetes bacterium]MCH9701322.1 carbonic anhydrase [Actinomycetes bacterium]MCH9759159.1 carbonic anhydrase [Actinomycetes bacterium]
MDHTVSTGGGASKSRRYLLGAIPVAAFAVAACSSENSDDSVMQENPPKPRPATPEEAIQVLMDGNNRFKAREPQIRNTAQIDAIWSDVTGGQEPFASVLGCADSRLAPEVIFDQFVGDVFVVREAGNIAASPTNLGSLEFGQAVLKSKALVVLGHSSCGAVKAAFENATPGGNIQAIVDAIRPGIVGASDLDDAIVRNVRATIDTVRADSKLLDDAEKSGAIKIVGAFYDIKTSRVRLL